VTDEDRKSDSEEPSWWNGGTPRKTSLSLRVDGCYQGVEARLPLSDGTWDIHVSDSRDCVILFARRDREAPL
jgi:hypothetical protein